MLLRSDIPTAAISPLSPEIPPHVETTSDTTDDSYRTNVKNAYVSVQNECETEGLHLLPCIENPGNSIEELKKETKKNKEIGMYVEERNRALEEAFKYRTLAESSQKEVVELKKRTHQRVTAVRNFWRNEVIEGRSRSGHILKKSLH